MSRRRPRTHLGAAWRGLWHAFAASGPIVGVLVLALVLVDVLA